MNVLEMMDELQRKSSEGRSAEKRTAQHKKGSSSAGGFLQKMQRVGI